MITPDMLIADTLLEAKDSDKIAEVYFSFGMHCLGCSMAHGETVEEAAMVHGLDLDELLQALNKACEEE